MHSCSDCVVCIVWRHVLKETVSWSVISTEVLHWVEKSCQINAKINDLRPQPANLGHLCFFLMYRYHWSASTPLLPPLFLLLLLHSIYKPVYTSIPPCNQTHSKFWGKSSDPQWLAFTCTSHWAIEPQTQKATLQRNKDFDSAPVTILHFAVDSNQ